MAFAGRVGVDMKVKDYAASIQPKDIIAALLNEELGAVFQVSESNLGAFEDALEILGFKNNTSTTLGWSRLATTKPLS